MSDPKKGKVIVIVAPSGSGKTTIAEKLLNDIDKIRFSTSATTRKPREGEEHGREYFFLSPNEFDDLIEKDAFLEWEHYSGHRYGTLHSEVEKLVEDGYFPLLDIEVKGALNVKRLYQDDCLAIFIKPPSLEELKKRLLKRKSETDESLKKRLETAKREIEYADQFDFVVINDKLDEAYSEVKNVVLNFIRKNS